MLTSATSHGEVRISNHEFEISNSRSWICRRNQSADLPGSNPSHARVCGPLSLQMANLAFDP